MSKYKSKRLSRGEWLVLKSDQPFKGWRSSGRREMESRTLELPIGTVAKNENLATLNQGGVEMFAV